MHYILGWRDEREEKKKIKKKERKLSTHLKRLPQPS